jgi:hypothetical protein
MKATHTLSLLALLIGLALPGAAQADFGLAPGSVKARAENKNGTLATQASSHPYAFKLSFDLKLDKDGHTEGGEMRDVIIDLPPGLIGNPQAVPRCPRQDFEGTLPDCSPSTQIGVLRALLPGVGEVNGPLYNLAPPPGFPLQLGFAVAGFESQQFASLRSEEGYGATISAPNLPSEVSMGSATIWGTPADPDHDPERGSAEQGTLGSSSDAPLIPFLTLPADCSQPQPITVKADSKLNPGVFDEESAFLNELGGKAEALAGCEAVPFDPKIASQPTSKLASNPSGLEFETKLPNQGLLNKGATAAETEPEKVEVILPEGVSVNPSFAEGISVCSEVQYKAEQLDSAPGQGCPQASKIGSMIAHSPLLEEPVEGALYLAAPYENPFDSLAALYLVAKAPERGVLVKQAGEVSFDPETGQITSTFSDLPPVPYSSFKVHLREGARAPLVTPRACGQYETVAMLTPFSSTTPLERKASFKIERGADGGACPSGGLPPFKPSLLAGTTNNAAGHFSPFNLRISRTDAEQEITHFSIKLPPGLTGKLAGVPYCPDAAIAAAKARTGPHGGQEELSNPSCPAASEVGRSLAGAGAGTVLTYVPGKVYLAGPYNGSKMSVVAITAAKAGPFDLGTVVIREALQINPETAEVFIDATGSDPVPHIIRGVPVRLRDIRAYVDKPDFVLNPTDCTPTSTASTVLGAGLDFSSEADDNPLTVTSPFQAADCAALPFKPQLGLRLIGGTKRGAFPAFKAHLQMNGIGEAGIASAQVTLPKSAFIEQGHFKTICTRPQFKAGAGNGASCPAGSIYGKASAITPLLGEPLTGPVFLRANGGERDLPDLVVALSNSQVDFNLIGHVDSIDGRLRNTFAASPDAPVTSFDLEMAGGQKGLFVNSRNLCARKYRALAGFAGQNGKAHTAKPVVKVKCKGKGKAKGNGRGGRR